MYVYICIYIYLYPTLYLYAIQRSGETQPTMELTASKFVKLCRDAQLFDSYFTATDAGNVYIYILYTCICLYLIVTVFIEYLVFT